jgi:hypothetical protein
MRPTLLPLLGGLEIVLNELVPYDPPHTMPGWVPTGPNRIAIHPRAWADFKAQLAERDRLIHARPIGAAPGGRPDVPEPTPDDGPPAPP